MLAESKVDPSELSLMKKGPPEPHPVVLALPGVFGNLAASLT
jgi:hypothetical protein